MVFTTSFLIPPSFVSSRQKNDFAAFRFGESYNLRIVLNDANKLQDTIDSVARVFPAATLKKLEQSRHLVWDIKKTDVDRYDYDVYEVVGHSSSVWKMLMGMLVKENLYTKFASHSAHRMRNKFSSKKVAKIFEVDKEKCRKEVLFTVKECISR